MIEESIGVGRVGRRRGILEALLHVEQPLHEATRAVIGEADECSAHGSPHCARPEGMVHARPRKERRTVSEGGRGPYSTWMTAASLRLPLHTATNECAPRVIGHELSPHA